MVGKISGEKKLKQLEYCFLKTFLKDFDCTLT